MEEIEQTGATDTEQSGVSLDQNTTAEPALAGEAPQPEQQVQEPAQEQPVPQAESEQIQPETPTEGPRRMSFFTLVMKTFAGFGGGIAGTVVLLVIFLAASSILQPVIGSVDAAVSPEEISPLFIVVLIGMVFATSLISSMIGSVLLSYTERDRYTRTSTTMGQIFIMNIVIFAFVLPIYLTSSTTSLELTAYTAGLQVILSAIASALTLELLHDPKYPLLAVYNTVLAILAAMTVSFMLYFITGNATILLFIALPIIWGFIGFFQAAVAMFYYWVFQTWGKDYLATESTFGVDYGIPDTTEEEEEEVLREDTEGSDFMNQ